MALSPTESALLTQTCENMNIAANTCRDVLEMLRSLGNTGVVDIATHNNATEAHANATNLVHINSTGGVSFGVIGQSFPSTWYSNGQIDIAPSSRTILSTGDTSVAADTYLKVFSYTAITDGSQNLIELATAGQETSKNKLGLYTDTAHITGLKDNETVDIKTGISYIAGGYRYPGNYLHSYVAFVCCNGTTSSEVAQVYSDCIVPSPGVTMSLGLSGAPFDTAYLRTAATVTSDRREKSGISAIGSEAVDFIKSLRPVQFTVKNGKQNVLEADENGDPTNIETVPGTRRHWGLIAQEVQEALVSAGYDPSACAVWSLADKNDPDSRQALRYEELIAPMIKIIQNQQERIEALERRIA